MDHSRYVWRVSEAEKLQFGDVWPANDDRRQERQLTGLIYSSPEAQDLFISACAAEARAILHRHADVLDALTAALLKRRTLGAKALLRGTPKTWRGTLPCSSTPSGFDASQIDDTIVRGVAARRLAQNKRGGAAGRMRSVAAAPLKLSTAVTESNPIEKVLTHFAERLRDAPGAARLARLARTATRIPQLLLMDLENLIVQLDDVQFVGDDIALSLIDVGFCGVKYADATAFASALEKRLRRYLDDPRAALDARGDFMERNAWWRFALARAAELCRWPAIVLTEIVPTRKER